MKFTWPFEFFDVKSNLSRGYAVKNKRKKGKKEKKKKRKELDGWEIKCGRKEYGTRQGGTWQGEMARDMKRFSQVIILRQYWKFGFNEFCTTQIDSI
jgi:hypothetical protein